MTAEEDRVIEVARDLVALWQNPKIQGLPRAERNATIDLTRERLIEAVKGLEATQQETNRGTPNL